MRDQIRHDGEYPFDHRYKCGNGHTHALWRRIVWMLPKEAALAIVGATGDQWILNKGYVVFSNFAERAQAVYNHDGHYSIIESVHPMVVDKYGDRRPGELPGLGGNLAITIAMVSAPDEIFVKPGPCDR